MSNGIQKLLHGLLLFLGLALLPTVMSISLVEAAQRQPNMRTERTPAMREFVYKRFSHVRELADQGELAQAISSLDELRKQGSTTSYEAAMMWNLYAYLHYTGDDYASAIQAYEKVIAQENIPQSLHASTLYSLAQLQIAEGNYQAALNPLQQWFDVTEEPGPRAWVFLAQVQLQLDDLEAAGHAIRTALDKASLQGVAPEEQWYLLARAIHYQQQDYERLRDVLASLALTYPKREYWVQLAAVFGELGEEKRQIAALESAHEQGFFEKENDYVTLAQLLLGNDVPFKAARIIENGLEKDIVKRDASNLRLLADAWTMARELDAAVVVLNEAAPMADNGELYLRLSQVELDRTRWQEASLAANKALAKGGLGRPYLAHIIRGLAAFNRKQYGAAREAFGDAATFEEGRETARQWLQYVEREQDRQQRLEAMTDQSRTSSGESGNATELTRLADELTIGS